MVKNNDYDDEDLKIEIDKAVSEIYKKDLDSIKIIVNVASQMIKNDNIKINGDLVVSGDLKAFRGFDVGGKNGTNGIIGIINKSAHPGILIDGNYKDFGGMVFTYNKDSKSKDKYGQFIAHSRNNLIYPGLILAWAGSTQSIPEGWALCDGQEGRPNLINMFVKGSDTSKLFYKGGQSTVSLTKANLPPHSHKYSKTLDDYQWKGKGGNKAEWQGKGYSKRDYDETSVMGLNKAFDIIPSYYSLAYIIKL